MIASGSKIPQFGFHAIEVGFDLDCNDRYGKSRSCDGLSLRIASTPILNKLASQRQLQVSLACSAAFVAS